MTLKDVFRYQINLLSTKNQVAFLTLIVVILISLDLSKKRTEVRHELELVFNTFTLYVHQIITDSLYLSDYSNYRNDASILDNFDMKNFYYHNNFNDIELQKRVIIKNIFSGFQTRVNFRNFGVIFPEDEIIISSSPYKDFDDPIPFADLCSAIKICTKIYDNNSYHDNGLKVSNNYFCNSNSVITLYIAVKYTNHVFVYFLKSDVPKSSCFSSEYN